MVIKHQSYYPMTDVKVEVMFRTPKNIPVFWELSIKKMEKCRDSNKAPQT